MARPVARVTRGQGLHTKPNAMLHLLYSDASDLSTLRRGLPVDRYPLPMLMQEHQTDTIRITLKPNFRGA
jgi:hypothetical protein